MTEPETFESDLKEKEVNAIRLDDIESGDDESTSAEFERETMYAVFRVANEYYLRLEFSRRVDWRSH